MMPGARDTDANAFGEGSAPSGSGYDLYRGGDADLLHALLDRHFTPHRMDVVGRKDLDARFRVLHQGAVRAYELGYGTDVVASSLRPPEIYVIRLRHRGRASLDIQGARARFSPSVVSPGQVVVARWDADTTTRMMCLPRRLVDNGLREQLGTEPAGPVPFEPTFDVRVPAVKAWIRLAQRFTDIADAGVFAHSPLALAHFEKCLVHGLLTVQPHPVREQLLTRAPVSGAGAVERAVAYCDAHLHEPISVADLAGAARVSVRTLQEQFRLRRDITPLGYLRQARLAAAHSDLVAIAQGRAVGGIAEVAARWGFLRRRNFTSAYRAAYGYPPTRTLDASDPEDDPRRPREHGTRARRPS